MSNNTMRWSTRIWHWLLSFRQRIFGRIVLYRDTKDSCAEANKRVKKDLRKLYRKYNKRASVGFLIYNSREHAVNAMAADEVAGLLKKSRK